jgi:mono/diheme cytochrome c family protein
MQSYAHQIPAEDRWRIAAYVKTLQRSQFASAEDLAKAEALAAAAPADKPASTEHANEH